MRLKDFLIETISETIKNYNEFSILEWLNIFLEYENIFLNYPQVKNINFFNDEYFEQSYDNFNIENFEIMDVDLDSDKLFFRGDINQESTEILCSYIDDSIEFEILEEDNYDLSLTDEEFLKKIFGKNWIKILEENYNYKHI
jgi:hypothetical protein